MEKITLFESGEADQSKDEDSHNVSMVEYKKNSSLGSSHKKSKSKGSKKNYVIALPSIK